ncbi:MAG TPA: SDR family NAD(P)-dependent oxidoreductase, partial [Terriglobia bacterium]|nr:SDR family NAD(P)-dependent oxidoreductase [Terriglobia bacterium]
MEFIPDRFRGRCALVVGGAQGIGKGIAVRLAREGASVMIGDIDRDMMARTEREISEAGGSIRTVSCDVRRKREVQRMVAQTLRWQSRIDVLMYVAGVGKLVPFTKTD